MPQYIYFAIIILLQSGITWWFYRQEKFMAFVIAAFINVFILSMLLIIDTSFDVNMIVLGIFFLLAGSTGYFIFFKGGFKKALAVSIFSNTVALGVAYLMIKYIG